LQLLDLSQTKCPGIASILHRFKARGGCRSCHQSHQDCSATRHTSTKKSKYCVRYEWVVCRQPAYTCIGHAAHSAQGITRLNSVREESSFSQQVRERETDLVCVGPASDDEYLESWISQSPAHPINSFEAQLGQDEGSAGLSERSLYPAGPSTPSLDRLEFPTSPLSPSSLLPSGTTYESHLSLCQTPHGTETTALDFDNTSLLSIVGGSCRDGSSSRSGRCRHIAPDLASASPVQRRPRSGLAHKVSTPLPSSSKADVISDLLMRDDPWNEIGKILGLPPILTADATYFDNIRSLDALSRERIATQAPSRSSSPVNGREHSDTVRDDGTWSRSVRSDGDILVRPDSSRHWFSRDGSSRIPSPLCCRDSPEKRVLSPSPSVPSIRGAHSPNCAESHSPSLSTSRNVIVPSEAPRSLLEPQPRLVSPRLPEGPLTPRRPTQLPPKHLKSPKTSISCSPGVESTPWNTIGFDIAELISNLSRTRSTGSQRPKLECPDLFLDEDSLEGDF